MNKCLICSKETTGSAQYHKVCLKKLFGSEALPSLEFDEDTIHEWAKIEVKNRVTIPGVQTKLSLKLVPSNKGADKLTFVTVFGGFIMKPQAIEWLELPENEHCTMLMAQELGIETVPFGLIRLASGSLAYITKRIDRGDDGRKFAMEDMCQLSEKLTENKYRGSYEQIAKLIKRYTQNPIYDLSRFFDIVLFSYLTANADMHLKNFSLINDPIIGWRLAPAYDLLSTRLVITEKEDPDIFALTLNAKKRKLTREDLFNFGLTIGLNRKQVENSFKKLIKKEKKLFSIIESSFLSEKAKAQFKQILSSRFDILKQ